MSLEQFLKTSPLILFGLLLLLQFVLPRRKAWQANKLRLLNNIALFGVNALVTRLLVPLSLASAALLANEYHIGLLNNVALPNWLVGLAAIIVLDFAMYWQHVATHKVPFLWRMHRVHHSDQEMDITTTCRFHTFELLLSLVYKAAWVVILGVPVLIVLVFEFLLFVGSAFTHSNIKLPHKLDQMLRLFIATPDVHRAHHSVYVNEQDTNYGFFLIWWDKLFNTYTECPKDGHEKMKIGLQNEHHARIDEILLAPFYDLKQDRH